MSEAFEYTPPGRHLECNLCGSSQSRILLSAEKRVHAPQHVVTYRYCTRCSLVYLDLDYEEWMPRYVEAHGAYDKAYHRSYFDQEAEETASVIEHLESIWPQIRQGQARAMADVGAGAGGSLSTFHSLGWRVTGVEPGRAQAEFARASNGLELKQEPYREATFPPDSLDLLYAYHALEHLPRPYEALRNFYRHLKPGGKLYVEVPNVMDTCITQLGFGHVSLFSPRTLTQSARLGGFEVLRCLDRSRFPTFGIGLFCEKPREDRRNGTPDAEPAYAPIGPSWKRDPEWILRWKLWYAFHAGRGREALSWRVPLRLLWKVGRSLWAPTTS